jgi:NitT/TauT family transport system substrate-binding protein
MKTPRPMLRRQFLTGIAANAGLGLLGLAGPAIAAASQPRTVVRLGYRGDVCEAATFIAPTSAHFARAHLAPRLVGFASQDELLAALHAGTIDAASVQLPSLLAPLEAKHDIRVVAGLHAGCLRFLVRDSIELNAITDLKGTLVAADALHSPSMKLLSAILSRAGVDPHKDVRWQAFAGPDLETALDAKTVRCVATADPLGYAILSDHKADAYLDSTGTGGGFSCGGDLANSHHCFLALHGGLVAAQPRVAAALTRAYLAATAAIGHGVGPAAVAEAGAPLSANISLALGILATYDWTTSTDLVTEELELTARDFRHAGLLNATTDPEALAERGYADVLHA